LEWDGKAKSNCGKRKEQILRFAKDDSSETTAKKATAEKQRLRSNGAENQQTRKELRDILSAPRLLRKSDWAARRESPGLKPLCLPAYSQG
jgi:hypothetical protein